MRTEYGSRHRSYEQEQITKLKEIKAGLSSGLLKPSEPISIEQRIEAVEQIKAIDIKIGMIERGILPGDSGPRTIGSYTRWLAQGNARYGRELP